MLNREDPEGLLEAGAPLDEYSNEAADLAGLLRGGRPVTGDVLADVWEHWFGPDSGYVRRTSKRQINKLAEKLDALRRLGHEPEQGRAEP